MRRQGRLRRLVMAALAGVVVLATWRGWADPLVEAWSAWIDGDAMSEVSLWGREMRFWERFGKVCIFLAGLSVLLDLADPEDLRNWGRAASDRIKEARARAAGARMEKHQALTSFSPSDQREAARLGGLSAHVKDALVETRAIATSPYTGSVFVYLRSPGDWDWSRRIAALVSIDSRFDEAGLRRLHETLLAARPGVCTQPSQCNQDGRDLCDPCQTLLSDLVTGYVDDLLNDSERELLHRQQQLTDRAATGTTALFGRAMRYAAIGALGIAGLAALASGAGIGDRSVTVDLWLGLGVAAVAWLLFLTAYLLVSVLGPRQQLALLLEARAAATVPVRALHFTVAMILDKAKPGHFFRWIAFVLFVVGSHFDLLAT